MLPICNRRDPAIEYKDTIYESILKSYNKDKLYNEIVSMFEKYIIVGIHDNSKEISKHILSIKYKKDTSFTNTQEFKQLINLYNYNLTYTDPAERYIYLEPNVPNDMTKYVYEKCNGIVYHVTKNQKRLDNILKYGLKPKSPTYRSNSERIYVIAANKKENLIKKIKHIKSIFRKDPQYEETAILKIDLNKLPRKLNFYIDPAMNDPYTLWTAEYIPASCITTFKL